MMFNFEFEDAQGLQFLYKLRGSLIIGRFVLVNHNTLDFTQLFIDKVVNHVVMVGAENGHNLVLGFFPDILTQHFTNQQGIVDVGGVNRIVVFMREL